MQATQARRGTAGHSPVRLVPRQAARRRRRVALRGAVTLLGLAAIAGGSYLAFDAKTVPRVLPPPAVVTVTEGPVVGTLRLSGRLEFERTLRIGTSLPGQLVALGADVGDDVRRGQMLARFDDLEQRAAVRAADVERSVADIELNRAELRLLDSAGVAGQFVGGVPLEELLENADPEVQLDAMTAAAQVAKQKILAARARGQLAQRTVRAPEDGVVVTRGFDRGETVTASPPGPPLFVLDVRPGHLVLHAAIGEGYLSRVQAGPVRVVVVAQDRSLVGEVVGVTGPAGSSSGLEGAARYQVDVAIDDADQTLHPGLSASLELPMTSGAKGLRVPRAAIGPGVGENGDGASSGTLRIAGGDGQVRLVPVELGVTDGQSVEVTGPGLGAGAKALLPPPG